MRTPIDDAVVERGRHIGHFRRIGTEELPCLLNRQLRAINRAPSSQGSFVDVAFPAFTPRLDQSSTSHMIPLTLTRHTPPYARNRPATSPTSHGVERRQFILLRVLPAPAPHEVRGALGQANSRLGVGPLYLYASFLCSDSSRVVAASSPPPAGEAVANLRFSVCRHGGAGRRTDRRVGSVGFLIMAVIGLVSAGPAYLGRFCTKRVGQTLPDWAVKPKRVATFRVTGPARRPGPLRATLAPRRMTSYLIENESGAAAGFGVAMEMSLPLHDVTGAVSFAVKPLKTSPEGNAFARFPLLMFMCTVARNVESAGTVTF